MSPHNMFLWRNKRNIYLAISYLELQEGQLPFSDKRMCTSTG